VLRALFQKAPLRRRDRARGRRLSRAHGATIAALRFSPACRHVLSCRRPHRESGAGGAGEPTWDRSRYATRSRRQSRNLPLTFRSANVRCCPSPSNISRSNRWPTPRTCPCSETPSTWRMQCARYFECPCCKNRGPLESMPLSPTRSFLRPNNRCRQRARTQKCM